MPRRRRTAQAPAHAWYQEHSLSLVIAGLLALLLLMYARADASTHLGAFYGNAIADWLGVLVFVIVTKYFFEVGSGESRRPSGRFHVRIGQLLRQHSLTLVLALTGAVWVALYVRSEVDSRSGQVLGNIVSDWTQVLGLVLLTKYARERGSKEGH